MKSTFRLFIGTVCGTTALCLTGLLSGCGQTGPLYLPQAPAAKSAKSKDPNRNIDTAPVVPSAPVLPTSAPTQ